jgi:glycosyltransferase involved in cell wall biosynthesis
MLLSQRSEAFLPMRTVRKLRIGFVNTHPIQYFAPLYAYLNRTEEFAITALYLSDFSVRGSLDRGFGQTVKWDVDLLSGYDVRFVEGAGLRDEPKGFFSIIAPQIWRDISRGSFDAVVVHGHTPAAILIAMAAARWAELPVFSRGETHLKLNRGSLKRLVRKPLLRMFYRSLSGALAIGSANATFYRAMGLPEERIFSMPYTVDNARFTEGSRLSDVQRKKVRAELGVADDDPVVLYAAKLQARKHPDDLLCAAARLKNRGIRFHVVMVGSGEMAAALVELAARLQLGNVQFRGFVNQSALPQVYGAADIFVLPAQNEPWGLAVNEAMCAGLPIVASAEVGCVADLVQPHVNGQTFAAGDVEGLANALHPILVDKETRRRMSAASRDIISRWSYAECAAGLKAALDRSGVLGDGLTGPVH